MATLAEMKTAYDGLDATEKKEFAAGVGLQKASTKVNDYLWLLIVGGVVIALLIAVASFAVSANAENLLAVFTAIMGFLGGLIAPSPISTPLAPPILSTNSLTLSTALPTQVTTISIAPGSLSPICLAHAAMSSR